MVLFGCELWFFGRGEVCESGEYWFCCGGRLSKFGNGGIGGAWVLDCGGGWDVLKVLGDGWFGEGEN